jgi:hypothetical protein
LPSCFQPMTIPTGVSTYPVPVIATYSSCAHDARAPHCTQSGMPPLPPGRYEAYLAQALDLVPPPPSIAIDVTA